MSEIYFNKDKPLKMYIDINSCFATIVQQAYYHLRGKPVAIVAYQEEYSCILAASIEAKKFGIDTGMRVYEARKICPKLIILENEVELVRDVSDKFFQICQSFSPKIEKKSIDEVVIDFSPVIDYWKKSLIEIGLEIKKQIRSLVGDWIRVSVGIGTNRMWAKLAASLKKPDGLYVIDYKNVLSVYSSINLKDLPGINSGYETRLNNFGIFKVIDFLETDKFFLKKYVFQSRVGEDWFYRLRGFEVDERVFSKRVYGQQYTLKGAIKNTDKLREIIMILVEKMTKRLREDNYYTSGCYLGLVYQDGDYWGKSKKFSYPINTSFSIFERIMTIFNSQSSFKEVKKISVGCFDLQKAEIDQVSIFEIDNKKRKLAEAVDLINKKFGDYSIYPGLIINSLKIVPERISFGR